MIFTAASRQGITLVGPWSASSAGPAGLVPAETTQPLPTQVDAGRGRMAEYLLAPGAELNGTPSWGEATPLDAADSLGTGREALVEWLRSHRAQKSVKAAVRGPEHTA
jgi:hypothetical protein